MVLATIVLRLFAFVHDHFLSTHKVLQLYDAQAPARSNRDARRRRRTATRRTRRRLGRRRMGRRPWRRTRRRRHLGFEGPSRCDLGLHRAPMARGDWSLARQRPSWRGSLVGYPSPPNTCDQRLIGAGHSRTRLTVPARLLPRCRYSRPHHRSRDASIVPIAGAARALRHDRSPATARRSDGPIVANHASGRGADERSRGEALVPQRTVQCVFRSLAIGRRTLGHAISRTESVSAPFATPPDIAGRSPRPCMTSHLRSGAALRSTPNSGRKPGRAGCRRGVCGARPRATSGSGRHCRCRRTDASARHRQPSRLVANAIASGETADLTKAIGACEVADCDAGAAGRVERFVRLPMPSSRSRPGLVHAVTKESVRVSGSSICAWLASSSCRLVLYTLRQRVR